MNSRIVYVEEWYRVLNFCLPLLVRSYTSKITLIQLCKGTTKKGKISN